MPMINYVELTEDAKPKEQTRAAAAYARISALIEKSTPPSFPVCKHCGGGICKNMCAN